MQPGPTRVYFSGLDAGWYVKELRYNGATTLPEIVDLKAQAMSQSLEVVLGDKPATLGGSVVDGDHSVPDATVVLVPSPMDSASVFLAQRKVVSNEDGRFRFPGLAPRDYRVVAVPPGSANKLEEPYVLERLLADAEPIQLSAGNLASVSVKLADRPQ